MSSGILLKDFSRKIVPVLEWLRVSMTCNFLQTFTASNVRYELLEVTAVGKRVSCTSPVIRLRGSYQIYLKDLEETPCLRHQDARVLRRSFLDSKYSPAEVVALCG